MNFLGLRNSLKINKNWLWVIGGVAAINITMAVVSFLKDIMLAAYMGTSPFADILMLAFFIPDTIGNNLIGSAIGIACIPLFSVLYAEGNLERIRKTVSRLIFLLVACFSILFLATYSFLGKDIIILLASGLDKNSQELCLRIFYFFTPMMMLCPIQIIYSAVLQAKEKFIAPSAAPIIFNIIFLIGILFCWMTGINQQLGVYVLAFSMLAGVLLMLIFTAVNYAKYSGLKAFRSDYFIASKDSFGNREDLRTILGLFVPYVLLLLSSQGVLFVERNIASGLEAGTVSGLNYAYRLAQFPSWVFISAISTVILPSLSKLDGMRNMEKLINTIEKAILLVIIIALPLTLAFYFLRVPIVSILFQRGAFNEKSILVTSGILEGYSLTIVFTGITAVCLRVLLAARKIWLPLAVFVCSAFVNVGMDFFLVGHIGNKGLGYGAAVGALINSILIFYIVVKEFNLNISKYSKKIFKIVEANLLLTFFLIVFKKLWIYILPESLLARLAYTGISIGICGGIYLLSLRVNKVLNFDL